MKLLTTQTDRISLSAFGAEASAMLARHDFTALANRFGYAVAFDRAPSAAIEADFLHAISSPNRANVSAPEIVVRYFAPNDTGLIAAVECSVAVSDSAVINLELIVTGKGDEKFITVEGISGVGL